MFRMFKSSKVTFNLCYACFEGSDWLLKMFQRIRGLKKLKIVFIGSGPGLVVIGGDSWSRGIELKS